MLKKTLPALLLITAFIGTSASAADLKIGVVDMAKAFSEYYKTKEANAQLQENAQKAKEELSERLTALKKLADDLEKLRKEAQDPVLNDEVRAKKRSDFESKANEMRSLDKDIQDFRQRREGQLQQEGMQQRKGLYEEIMKKVVDKGKADGYDLVFDKSGVSASLMPFLLHAKEGATQDFTAEVIVDLNKSAPAAAAAPEKK
ncbi:MAG: OmpH family outer membrane protein [Roseimicrobium sp.]